MTLEGVENWDLNIRVEVLRQIIDEYQGDPRLPTPMWALAVIENEIGDRMRQEDHTKIPDNTLERRREVLWDQIQNATNLYIQYGKILDERKQKGVTVEGKAILLAQIKKLQAQLEEKIAIEVADRPPNQIVRLQTLVMKAIAKLRG